MNETVCMTEFAVCAFGLAPSNPNRTRQIAQCAAKVANQLSIAGLINVNADKHPILANLTNAFLGNTFSGISDTLTHVGQGSAKDIASDVVLSGTTQGIPIGSGLAHTGVAGTLTNLGVNAITRATPFINLSGTATELAEEGLAGPVGLAKFAIDGAIYAGAVHYCSTHL